MRVCSQPGCGELVPDSGRCPTHTRTNNTARSRGRGTTKERGYDAAYQRQRKGVANLMAAGEVIHCWRCAKVIYPHQLSLGHCDDDRTVIHGPEHLACNLAHTRGGCTHISHL